MRKGEISPLPTVFSKGLFPRDVKRCRCVGMDLPFPKQHICNSSKLKEFADENSKFDDNGRKFSERIENTVGKGEIACYEQFLLFQKCFQKTCTANM